jgi:hypothetical protein
MDKAAPGGRASQRRSRVTQQSCANCFSAHRDREFVEKVEECVVLFSVLRYLLIQNYLSAPIDLSAQADVQLHQVHKGSRGSIGGP